MALKRLFSLNSLGYFFEEAKFDKVARQLKHKKTEPFPWSFKGIEKREPHLRMLTDRILGYNKITLSSILTEQWFVYERVLKCLGEMDISPVKEDLEKNLYDSLNVLIGTMKQENKYFKLEKSEGFDGDKPTVNITDSLAYRGLSIDRSLNKALKDYHIYFDKDIGVVCFTDNELSDPFGYVDQAKMQRLHAVNRQLALQVLLWIRSPYVLRMFDGEVEVKEEKGYNFTQMCVFETQCEEPKGKVKDEKSESYMEWMGKFRPGKFVLADLNDFLQFNPLVRN